MICLHLNRHLFLNKQGELNLLLPAMFLNCAECLSRKRRTFFVVSCAFSLPTPLRVAFMLRFKIFLNGRYLSRSSNLAKFFICAFLPYQLTAQLNATHIACAGHPLLRPLSTLRRGVVFTT